MIGEAESMADHLLQTAPAGAIVIGRETYRATAGRFNVEPLPPISAPDRAETLPRYRVKSTIACPASFASTDFHGMETKLMGRTAERQQIIDALETMLSERRAQLVTLLGLPGVGMSRMLKDLFSHLTARKELVLLLAGRCSPLFADTSYSLTAALLPQRFSLDEGDMQLQIHRKLRIGLRWFRAHWLNGKQPAGEWLPWPPRLDEPPEPEPSVIDAALNQTASILGQAQTETMLDPASLDDSRAQTKQRSTAAIRLLARSRNAAAAHATSLGDTTTALRHLERARTIHDEARGKQAREVGEERRIATFPDRVRLRLNLGDALRRAGRLDDAAGW